ncbi:hypothetical protein TNCV_77861 [Trichonephila clavipes]|nr:hypothetical protein TNCV_77861 [Trichonephila clavipes]
MAVTDQLKAIPISEFHQCHEEWKKRLQRCVASEGSYFEGDSVELTVLGPSQLVCSFGESPLRRFGDFHNHTLLQPVSSGNKLNVKSPKITKIIVIATSDYIKVTIGPVPRHGYPYRSYACADVQPRRELALL